MQEPNHATSLANSAAIALLSGKPSETHKQYLEWVAYLRHSAKLHAKHIKLTCSFCAASTLRTVAPKHPLLEDLAAKEALFDEAAAKFSVSASA